VPLPFCYVVTKQKEEGNDNVIAVAFFVALQRKKKKATTAKLSLPFLLRCNITKRRGQWQCCDVAFFAMLQ
jgi:hypothetical protein